MSSTSTTSNVEPRCRNSSVRPLSDPVAAADSRARTLVVPTATTRRASRHARPRRLGHAVALAVHAVIERVGLADRLERVEPDDELDRVDGGADGCDARQQLRRQVEAGGRRGGRARLLGVHGLVAVRTFEARRDVRRQGHLADVVEQRQRVDPRRVDEVDVERVAGRRARPDDEHRPALGGDELLAVAQLARRTHERLPVAPAGVLRFQQQHLGLPAAGASQSQAGRDHLRLVDDDDVALPQQRRGGRRPCGARAPRSPGRRAGAPRHAARSAPGRCAPAAGRSRSRPGARSCRVGRCASITARDDT